MVIPEGEWAAEYLLPDCARRIVQQYPMYRSISIDHEVHHLVDVPASHAGKPGSISVLNVSTIAVAANTLSRLVGRSASGKGGIVDVLSVVRSYLEHPGVLVVIRTPVFTVVNFTWNPSSTMTAAFIRVTVLIDNSNAATVVIGVYAVQAIRIDQLQRVVADVSVKVPTLRIIRVLVDQRHIRRCKSPLRRRHVPRPEEVQPGFSVTFFGGEHQCVKS